MINKKKIKNDWWKKDWMFWLLALIMVLGIILLIKILITGGFK
jgi:uncharacterized membrane protein YcjF (UPF0283 family)